MTETRQTALFLLSILTLVAALGGLAAGVTCLDQQRADNQTLAAQRDIISTLKTDKAKLKQELLDTSEAMEEAVLTGSRLHDENEVLRAQLAIRHKATQL